MEKYKVCMIGGGIGSLIGSTHRLGAADSGFFKIVAGAFSSRLEHTQQLGALLGISKPRCYESWKEMIHTESSAQRGARVVIIATPDVQHYEQALYALEHEMHVICDKPVTITAAEALHLRKIAKKRHLLFGVTYTQNGNPAFIEMKRRIRDREIGNIRSIRSHLFASWAMTFLEEDFSHPMHKQAWRLKKEYGEAGAVSDIGSHMYQYMHDIVGLRPSSLVSDLEMMHHQRTSDDTAHTIFRYEHYKENTGVSGVMSVSLAMTDSTESMAVEVLCDEGAARAYKDAITGKMHLVFNKNGKLSKQVFMGNKKKEIIEYRDVGVLEDTVLMFSTLYKEYGTALQEKRPSDFETYPSIQHGYEGMVFIEKAIQSHHNRAWVPLLFE